MPDELEAAVAKADEELFSKLRAMLGLDQVSTVNVGAAPTPAEVLEFFHAIGIEVAELWGMSETCGIGAVNRPGAGQDRHGRAGVARRRAQARRRRGAVCRGPFMMSGYRNLPEQTAETLDADGWLHTGDIAEIDADGFVTIVDRKKELIINAAGKNMSPANIEAELKTGSAVDRHRLLHRRHAALQHRADRARRRLRAGWAAQHELGDARWSSSPPSPR